jgi:hypothetical protein
VRVELTDVAKGRALESTSAAFETGEVTLACAETEQRPTILGLLASGRMRPDAGTVAIDGRADPGLIRRRVALVDAPDVSAPDADLPVPGVVAEELMFAGRRSDPLSVRRWLRDRGFADIQGATIGTVAPARRIRLLLELAVLRDGVEGLVVVSPDRHGGDPLEWHAVAADFAARGFAVLLIAGVAARSALEGGSR